MDLSKSRELDSEADTVGGGTT
ncbi:uncharacterized protein G2W53_013054 [Senna tora]|uniref:Uncharacterized protein n=1 Tax=Senna tora TaxID=362788 RepID=A0A834WS24_9FABA|nr:uncharacterized protein G2W53_013054 [Senna tora]